MTVYDILYLLGDDGEEIAVFDLTTCEEVFCGSARDAMYSDFGDCEVASFDLDHHDPRGVLLVLNIEIEEEEE